MLLSVVIPCYNSQKSIYKLVTLIQDEIEKIPGYECEIILVNDFSKDGTFDEIKKICREYSNVIGIDLAKNFGQHNAIMAALNYSKGDLIMGMDDDMQTHPSQLNKFIQKIDEGYDVVYGKYPIKKHSHFRNIGSKFNDFTVRKLIGKPKGLTACSYWICKRFVRDEIIKYHSFDAHIQGLFLRTTSRITNVEIEHFEREFGKTNYTLKKLIRLWMGCLNFTIVPIRFSAIMGMIVSTSGFIGMITVFIRKLLYPNMTAGWASTICVLTFFAGIILLFLGVIGEYVGRILLCINNSPQYVIREVINNSTQED